MISSFIKSFWTASIKRQLILGIALVHAVMMSLFVYDLIDKQRTFLTKQHEKKTKSLTKTIAASSTSWVLANDFIGLQEVITSLENYPGLEYVMILNSQGQILAHSNKKLVGKYLSDEKSKNFLTQVQTTQTVFENTNYIDVVSPIMRNSQHIGWARIALNKKDINIGLFNVTIDGLLYTLIAILVGVFFAYFMARGLTKSIDQIIKVIQKAKAGKENTRVNLAREDEIGILAREFDNMLLKLTEQHNLISSVINSSPDLIFYKDYYNFDGVYIGCNDAFCKFVGKSKDQIIGFKDFDLFDEATAKFFREKDQEMLSLNQSNRNEEWVKYPNGNDVLMDVLKTPLYNFDGSILGVLGLSRDITEKHYVQKELDNTNQILFEQSKLVEMGEMMSNIAHQWRQPLSIISTAATGSIMEKEMGILEDDSLIAKLNLINDNAQYLSQTIDTFRDYIRDKKEYKEVILQESIQKALGIVQAALDNNYIKLYHNLDQSEPIKIKLVAGELAEVIINIVNNAKDVLKEEKVDKGWIKIDLEQGKDTVTVTIEDNGGGVPNEVLPKIFDPYFTTKHQSVGTGLGLHMSYKIVTESLNGKLYVKNTEHGAKFFIELPLSSKDTR